MNNHPIFSVLTGKTAYYFNADVDNDWNTLGNWWMDSGYNQAATELPGSGDHAIINANCNFIDGFNGGNVTVGALTVNGPYVSFGSGFGSSVVTVEGNATLGGCYTYANLKVGGTCTLNSGTSIDGGTIQGLGNTYPTRWGTIVINNSVTKGNLGMLVGNITFNDSSVLAGMVEGNVVFNNTSAMNQGGWIFKSYTSYNPLTAAANTGNATFNNSSNMNDGTVDGDATFNGSSSKNGGTVVGSITCNTTGTCP